MSNCRKCRAELPDGAKFCPSCGAKQDTTRKPKSRGNGTGSVYKLPNGTWIAVRILGRKIDEQGKSHRITASKSGFKTKKEALLYLPYLTQETKAQKRKTVTFRQLYDAWEPTHKKSKSTMDCYRAAMNHFRPLWNEPVCDISVDDLQECMDDCSAGKRTLENMKALCGLLYKYAIPRNMALLNMGQYLVINGEAGLGKEGLPKDALEILTRNVGKVPYADYIVAECYLGFRPSELLDLDVSDYDRTKRAFTGGAKTEAGRNRTVTVSPKIQPTIDRLTGKKIAGPVFCDSSGSRMTIEAYRQHFYKALDACGIANPVTEVNGVKRRKYTPHSCRHTFSTLMKEVQAPDKDKLALIGHTSTEMLRHYQDVDIEGLRRITNAI
ncbi:MAG: tyrosine-type recombinase/integrase [Oscillospiraceae bacterium]|nr:tyrosine-type recombinase/integrase [Oscillospiraceae bacterium]